MAVGRNRDRRIKQRQNELLGCGSFETRQVTVIQRQNEILASLLIPHPQSREIERRRDQQQQFFKGTPVDLPRNRVSDERHIKRRPRALDIDPLVQFGQSIFAAAALEGMSGRYRLLLAIDDEKSPAED